MKALYDYRAQRFDELSFCKHAIINNVTKRSSGWWRGDYGGKKQHWFPANFTQEIYLNTDYSNNQNYSTDESNRQNDPGNSGSFDLVGANITRYQSSAMINQCNNSKIGLLHMFKITRTTPNQQLIIGHKDLNELQDWISKLQDCASLKAQKSNSYAMEKNFRIAHELSNLIIYCRAVQFMPERIGNFTEMSSFPETKIEKFLSPNMCSFLLSYNEKQFTRVYPKGSRIDSSNYDPIKLWNVGIQMAALNYQTPDRSMQLNQAKFQLVNGACGYVLRPEFMFDKAFTPYDINFITDTMDTWILSVQIIYARHLTKNKGRGGVISPFIEVEIIGVDCDSTKCKTATISNYR